MEQDLKKAAWREAATGGLWLGLALCAVMALGYVGRENSSLSFLTSLLQLAALIALPYFYARKMARFYGAAGYTYGQGLGFIFRMLIFAGIITGFGQFIFQNYVDPEYYRSIMEQTAYGMGLPDDQIDGMVRSMSSPIIMILAGIFGTIFYGGFVGLFVAIFTKRPADPFGGNDGEQNA